MGARTSNGSTLGATVPSGVDREAAVTFLRKRLAKGPHRSPARSLLRRAAVVCLLSLVTAAPAVAWDWNEVTVDSNGNSPGQFCTLRIDPFGRLHLGYFRYDGISDGNQNLKYATNPSPLGAGAWSTVTVDGSPSTGFYASMALALDGTPHFSYYDSYNRNLKHAWFDSTFGQWRREVVDQSGSVGQYTSIGVTGGGTILISYFDATRPGLKVATKPPGGIWSFTYPDVDGTVGLYTALVVKPRVEVAYYDLDRRDLKYAWLDGSTWRTARIDSIGDVGRNVAIASFEEATYIAYQDVTHLDLKVASRETPGGPWTVLTVDGAGDLGEGCSIACGQGGWPHVLYYDRAQGDLRYAARFNGTWIYNTPLTAGNVGRFSSIAFDPQGLPNLGVYNETDGSMDYAYGVGEQTGVGDLPAPGPTAVVLSASPNPMRGPGTLQVQAGASGPLRLRIYDLQGRIVRTLHDGPVEAGLRVFTWDGRDDAGRVLGSGIYFATAVTSARRSTVRLVVLR